MNSPTGSLSPIADDELELRELVLAIWRSRFHAVLGTLLGLTLSVVYAFFVAAPVYESTALLLPTQQATIPDVGAASLLLGRKAPGSGDVDLYQSLLTSRAVIHRLLKTPIRNGSDTGNGRLEPLGTILGIATNNPGDVLAAAKRISSGIKVDTKESGSGGIIAVKFHARTPWLAQEIGSATLRIGQEELYRVRAQRSEIILSRLAAASLQARKEWDSAAEAYTAFSGRNRSIVLPDQELALSRMQMERSAKEQKLQLARKEFEIQLLEQAKATPPLMILDSADMPLRPIAPKKRIIVVAGTALGAFISVAGILAATLFEKIRMLLLRK